MTHMLKLTEAVSEGLLSHIVISYTEVTKAVVQQATVQQALGTMFLSRFQGPFHAEPRLAPSRGVAM
jgi:hypothetical protein